MMIRFSLLDPSAIIEVFRTEALTRTMKVVFGRSGSQLAARGVVGHSSCLAREAISRDGDTYFVYATVVAIYRDFVT